MLGAFALAPAAVRLWDPSDGVIIMRTLLVALSTAALLLGATGASFAQSSSAVSAADQPVPDVAPPVSAHEAASANADAINAALSMVEELNGVRVGDHIEFDGGAVVLSYGDNYYDCPSGWTCLFEHADFNLYSPGYMWQFQDVTADYQDLSDYGAANKTSSWRNRHSHRAYLKDTNTGATRCLSPGYQHHYVGDSFNDIADKIWITTATSLC